MKVVYYLCTCKSQANLQKNCLEQWNKTEKVPKIGQILWN